jgi:hypothetical protein
LAAIGRIAFRNQIYRGIDKMQDDLDAWLDEYNYRRPINPAGISVRP